MPAALPVRRVCLRERRKMKHESQVLTPQPPADDASAGGIAARDVTVTYRNGHTALRDTTFAKRLCQTPYDLCQGPLPRALGKGPWQR